MSAHLRGTIAIRALIVTTLALIAAVRAGRVLRHPARHVRYFAARAVRRVPGRAADGAPLTDGEMRAFIALVRCWKHPAPERTPRS